MHIKRHCQFLLDKEKGKPDAKLRFRIKWNNNKNIVAFNVGFRVDIEKWSVEAQRCNKNTTHGKKRLPASVINPILSDFEQIAEQTFAEFEGKNIVPTKEEFKALFNEERGKKKYIKHEKVVFDYIDIFTEERGSLNQWRKATYQKFNTLKNHLKEFNPNITFNDFNEKGLTDYVNFLLVAKGFRNTTIKKQLGFLKWFLRWALSNKLTEENAILTFTPKIRTTEKKIIFLDWDELMTVYNFTSPTNKKYLERVRDVFCFCCFTSLRYSDVARLTRANVFNDYISLTTVKTIDSLNIELNKYSKSILDKYKDYNFENNLALPIITNQKMNAYLKEMGKICGIDKPIQTTYIKGARRYDEIYPKYQLLSTHAGRRTFICNALMLGITPQVVMKWTGHSDYKSMKPYIDVADSVKRESMNLFNR